MSGSGASLPVSEGLEPSNGAEPSDGPEWVGALPALPHA
jgi:hypothetical protein